MYEVRPDLNASLEDAKRPTVVVCSSEVHKLPGLISLLKHRLVGNGRVRVITRVTR